MKKRVLIIAFAALLILAMMPVTASAADTRTAYVSVSLAGEVQCIHEEVQAEDFNDNGVIDIDDAIKAVSDLFEQTYESRDQGWGLSIVDLWGDDSGAVGYYMNDTMAMNLEEEVPEGAYISVFSYEDSSGWSDSYAYFTEKYVEAQEGEEVTLTLKVCHFDEDWQPIAEPFAGAKVMEADTLLGTTDENGNITLSLSEGNHIITAYSNSSEQITVPASAIVAIDAEEEAGDGGPADLDKKNEGEKPADDSVSAQGEKTEESDDSPETGDDMGLLIFFMLAGVSICGLTALRKKV